MAIETMPDQSELAQSVENQTDGNEKMHIEAPLNISKPHVQFEKGEITSAQNLADWGFKKDPTYLAQDSKERWVNAKTQEFVVIYPNSGEVAEFSTWRERSGF